MIDYGNHMINEHEAAENRAADPEPELTERQKLDAEFGGWTDCDFCGEPVQVGHHCSECSRLCEDYSDYDKERVA